MTMTPGAFAGVGAAEHLAAFSWDSRAGNAELRIFQSQLCQEEGFSQIPHLSTWQGERWEREVGLNVLEKKAGTAKEEKGFEGSAPCWASGPHGSPLEAHSLF